MEDNGAIRYGTETAPGRTRPSIGWLAAIAAVLAAGMVLVLGGFRGSVGVATEETVPLGPDLLESAQLVVEDFAFAWNAGDVGGVDRFIPDDWDRVSLPGFADPRFYERDGRPALTDAITFLNSVATLSLGPCDASIAPPDARESVVVHCGDAAFVSDYLDAVGVNTWESLRPETAPVGIDGIVFGVQGERITTIDLDASRFTPQAYCIWMEETFSDLASTMFDLRCHPATSPADAESHLQSSGAFMAAGAPVPTWQDAAYRLIASFVDRFADNHNSGAIFELDRFLAEGITPADLPGFGSGGAPPPLVDYLRWSTRLMQIDPGRCSVMIGADSTIVTCPDLKVAGPLFDEPLAQPTQFTVDHFRRGRGRARARSWITGVEPLEGPGFSITAVCRQLQASDPGAAARAFRGDCAPIYTRAAAEALAEALERP